MLVFLEMFPMLVVTAEVVSTRGCSQLMSIRTRAASTSALTGAAPDTVTENTTAVEESSNERQFSNLAHLSTNIFKQKLLSQCTVFFKVKKVWKVRR